MARIHAFEFEDQAWFPSVIRQYMTDFLSYMGAWSKLPYLPFTERLAEVMRRTGDVRVVDLCSGGGGPALVITRELSDRLQTPLGLVLTDLYPSPSRFADARARGAMPSWVELETRPVDAQAVPADLTGFRLVCNGFHHLKPGQAERCLEDAVAQRQGVAIVELAQRSPFAMLQIALGVVWLLLITPFIKPFCWSRLLFTYVVPIVPACTLWDGIASCLRVYDPRELKALTEALAPNDYRWDCGKLKVRGLPVRLTYLIGAPD